MSTLSKPRTPPSNPGANGTATIFDDSPDGTTLPKHDPTSRTQASYRTYQRVRVTCFLDVAAVLRHAWEASEGAALHPVNDSGDVLAAITVDTTKVRFTEISPRTATSVTLITNAALPACTAAGSGVGKTLTADAVGILTVDGVAMVATNTLVVKNQANPVDNGVYTLTTEGTAGVAFILTRNTSWDQDAELLRGSIFTTSGGAANAGTYWRIPTTPEGEVIAANTLFVRDVLMLPGRNVVAIDTDVIPVVFEVAVELAADQALGMPQ